MAQHQHPVRVEHVDWPALLPFVHLFGSFRMAVHPGRLLVALLLVIGLFVFGGILDRLFGRVVFPGEIEQFAQRDVDDYDRWRMNLLNGAIEQARLGLVGAVQDEEAVRAELRQSDRPFDVTLGEIRKLVHAEHAEKMEAVDELDLEPAVKDQRRDALRKHREVYLRRLDSHRPMGVFEASLAFKLGAFERLMLAAVNFRFGIAGLSGGEVDPQTVVGALGDLMITLPSWFVRTHPGFLIIWVIGLMLLWAIGGGAISRLMAVRATQSQSIGLRSAMAFAREKYVSFFMAPLVPLIVVLAIWLVLATAGLLFYLAALDVIGALLFPLALVGGFLAAMVLILLAAGHNLFYPAIAIEGTDALDALTRAMSYVLSRPWHLIFYYVVGLVYGALTYVFVGGVIFLTMAATHRFVGSWVVNGSFVALIPRPQFGQLLYDVDFASLGFFGKIAASLIKLWSFLLVGLLSAYAINFYFSINTWVYLLLRRHVDGTEVDEVYLEEAAVEAVEAAVPAGEEPAGGDVGTTGESGG